MIHFFTTHPYILSQEVHQRSETSHLLVFDPTLSGYRQVLSWLRANPDETELFRAVVPIHDGAIDVGDCLHHRVDVAFTAYTGELSIVPVRRDVTGTWPRLTEHAVYDFEQSKSYLEQQALLPRAFSGLSRVQEFFLDKSARTTAILEAMDQFGLTRPQATTAWDRLNEAPVRYMKALPWVLVSGPYPLDPVKVTENIIAWINTGKTAMAWSSVPLNASVFPVCTRNKENAIIAPPYGVTKHEFYLANAASALSLDPFIFASTCTDRLAVEYRWSPQFADDVTFSSIDLYMEWWLPEMESAMRKDRGEAEARFEAEEVRLEFIRTIYLGSQVESASGKLIRAFFDENIDAKRARIDRYFHGHRALLNTPIIDIERDQASRLRTDTFFESSAEYWIYLLDRHKHVRV